MKRKKRFRIISKKKTTAFKELAEGFWCIAIKGRHWSQFKHWYQEWWKPLYWD